MFIWGTVANLPAVEYTVLLDRGTSLTADAALLTGRREHLPSREVLYPLHSRHRPAGNNTAYLGDGSRL